MIAVYGRGVGRVENMGIRSWLLGQGPKHLQPALKAVDLSRATAQECARLTVSLPAKARSDEPETDSY